MNHNSLLFPSGSPFAKMGMSMPKKFSNATGDPIAANLVAQINSISQQIQDLNNQIASRRQKINDIQSTYTTDLNRVNNFGNLTKTGDVVTMFPFLGSVATNGDGRRGYSTRAQIIDAFNRWRDTEITYQNNMIDTINNTQLPALKKQLQDLQTNLPDIAKNDPTVLAALQDANKKATNTSLKKYAGIAAITIGGIALIFTGVFFYKKKKAAAKI